MELKHFCSEKITTDKLSVHFDKLADKKFAYIKKKQYLCSVKRKKITNQIN